MPSRREILQGLTDRTGTTTWWGDALWNVQFFWFFFGFAETCWDHPRTGFVVVVLYIALVALPFQIYRRRRWDRNGRVEPRIPVSVNVAFGLAATLLIVASAFVLSGVTWLLTALVIGSLLLLTQTAVARRPLSLHVR